MEHREAVEREADPAEKVIQTMPNFAGGETAFLALVDEGLADIEAGRVVPFDVVAARFRRKGYGQT